MADLLPAEHREVLAHTKVVSDVLFSPDGQIIATEGEGDPVRLWDASSGRLIHEISGGVPAFHPSGRFLAITGLAGIQLWSIPEGKLVAATQGTFPFYVSRFNGRGDLLAGGGWSVGQFGLWRITGLEESVGGSKPNDVRIERVTTDPGGTAVFAWSPSGRRLARLRSDGHVYIEDMDQPDARFHLDRPANRLAYRTVVFLSEDQLGITTHSFQIWDLNSRRLVSSHEGRPPWMNPVVRSPNGRFLMFKDRVVRSEPFELLFALPFSEQTIWCADWSPDGRRLAYGMDGGTLIIWDLAGAHRRLSSLGLSWDEPGFRDLQRLEPISQLLAMKHDDAKHRKWDALYRDVAERVNEIPRSDALLRSLDWLTDNLPTTSRPFDQTAPHRIRQLADLANALSKANQRDLAERLLVRTIQNTTATSERDSATLLQVSFIHHSLGDLYNFQMPDRTEEAIAQYEKENVLIQEIMDDGTPRAVSIPIHRLFWMNHNRALALSETGDRVGAISCLNKALTIQESNPEIGESADWLSSSYHTLIDWLKAENRDDDAQSLRERARRAGVPIE